MTTMSNPHIELQPLVDHMERDDVDYYELYDGSWDNEEE